MKEITIMLKSVPDDAHPGLSTFESTREGSVVNDDDTVEKSIGWPNFHVIMHVDVETLKRFGNPDFLNVTIEPVKDKPAGLFSKEEKKKED